jgi:hypothetical protein
LPKATFLEMKARMEVFLADGEGRYTHDLPGWNQFRTTVCRGMYIFGRPLPADRELEKAARNVFVELIATPANKAVVMAAGGSQTELGATVINRRIELYNRRLGRGGPAAQPGFGVEPTVRREITTEDVAALLFAESLAPQTAARVPRAASISVLVNSTSFCTLARDVTDKGKVYRAVAIAWLDSRMNPMDLTYGLTIASNLGLTEQSTRAAVRLLTIPGATAQNRALAANTLRSIGGREHIPLLEPAFEDTNVLTMARPVRGRVNIMDDENIPEIQVRDFALAVAIQLAGEKPEDYGFIDQLKENSAAINGGIGYSYTRYYVPDDKRAAAFEKWKEWWARNKNKSRGD